jgi:hypothetical protein
MGRKRMVITFILVSFSLIVFSQQKDSVRVHLNHYTLTFGTGWTHYINSLEYGDENIRKDFAGLSLKFFWEPEYRLSMGLETGYYKLFKVKFQATQDLVLEVDRVVVPLLLLVRMRIIDNAYVGAGMGLAIISNKAFGGGRDRKIVTKTWSLSNYELSGSYIYPFSKHWLAGGEFKVFNFGNLDDWMYSLQVLCAVRF